MRGFHSITWRLMRLFAVLLIPGLSGLFQVALLTVGQLGAIVSLSFGSMVVVQMLKLIRV